MHGMPRTTYHGAVVGVKRRPLCLRVLGSMSAGGPLATGGQEKVYREITLEEGLQLPRQKYQHAAHVMLYAEWKENLYGRYPFQYAVMMQFRFDGTFGFPGGIVDEGESPEQAVTRELREEVCGDWADQNDGGCVVKIKHQDHVMTQVSASTGFCLHFYAKKLPDIDSVGQLEKRTLQARDWGSEVLGLVRCPLYTLPNGLGFPAFLNHKFIGSSRYQLLESLRRRGLMSAEAIAAALTASHHISSVVTKEEVDY